MTVDIMVVNTMKERYSKYRPQNVSLEHIDYFELKALEKQQVQDGQRDIPFSS